MSTPYSDIFIKFSSLIEDAELLSRLTDDEYETLLEIFLSKAKTVYFKECKIDLSDVDSVLKQFNETVDEQSQWIIAEAMKFIWCESQLFKEEKLRNSIGSKDYDLYSPANLIDKLVKLKQQTKKTLDEMVVSYTFDSFEGFN